MADHWFVRRGSAAHTLRNGKPPVQGTTRTACDIDAKRGGWVTARPGERRCQRRLTVLVRAVCRG
jgi:hypothetical protein